MPSFMGQDIIFPIDGPLGRIGQTLAVSTLSNYGFPPLSNSKD